MDKENKGYRFREGDLIICKPAEEKRSPETMNHELYARVIRVDRAKNELELDRYLKQGGLRLRDRREVLHLSDFEAEPLYQPMNEEDIKRFRNGLNALINSNRMPHGDSGISIKETFAAVEDYIRKNTKMHTIVYTEYGGIDWHDSCTTNEHLMQNGSYDVKDPDRAKAEYIYKDMTGMSTTESKPDGTVIKKVALENIPSFDEVYEAVKNGEDINVASPNETQKYDDHEYYVNELTYRYEGVTGRITKDYCYGQVSYDGQFTEQDIPLENVRYVAVENFLAPTKGIPSVQRFYHEPYTDLEEAKKALEDMQLHEGYRSTKELYIIDIEKEKETDWFKGNMHFIGKEFSLYVRSPEAYKAREEIFSVGQEAEEEEDREETEDLER